MIAKFVFIIGVQPQLIECNYDNEQFFTSGKLRLGRQKFKFHQTASCGKPCKTPLLDFWMGPCYDTPGCRIPDCCGMVSGLQSVFGIKYNATVPMTSGTFFGQLGSVGIGDTSCDI